MKKIFLPLMVVLLCVFFGCSKKSGSNTVSPAATNCEGVDSRFAAKLLPIIQANCATAGCHANGSANGPGALTGFVKIHDASDAIQMAITQGSMPKGGQLSVQDKNTILCWIKSGSPNN